MRFAQTVMSALVAIAPSRLACGVECVDDAPAYRDELLGFHKSICTIPSITGDEEKVGDFIVEYLSSKGYKTLRQDVPIAPSTPTGQSRFNVLAWRGAAQFDPRVIVTSHIDVVPPYIPYTIEDGPVTGKTQIKGRGTVDAKGSVAAMAVALEELITAKKVKDQDVMLVFVAGEEVNGAGMKAFNEYFHKTLTTPRLESAIFGEPTENKLACGHKGVVGGQVNTKGIAGHSGYPEVGKSATEIMMRAFVKTLDANLGSSDYYGNTTVNVGPITGGVQANVIADNATAQFSIRVAVDSEHGGVQLAKDNLEKIFKSVDSEAFTFDWRTGAEAVKCECNVQGFETAIENYGTDLPNLSNDKLVKYLYGPGTILVAHGTREALTVANLETAVEGYQTLILHALG